MTDRNAQMEARLDLIPGMVREIEESAELVGGLKVSLKEAEKELQEQRRKLFEVNREIAQIKKGHNFLPFDEQPDVMEGTPALNLVGEIMAQARIDKRKSLSMPLALLTGYGVKDAKILAIQEGLKVNSIAELGDAMANDDEWHKLISGVGARAKGQIEEAVRKALTEKQPLQSPEAKSDDEADTRKRRCSACDSFREQTAEVCVCGETTFELEYDDSPDSVEESLFDADIVHITAVPSLAGVSVMTCQNPDSGFWHGSFFYELDGEAGGEEVPHHNSQPFGTEEEAILFYLGKLSVDLIGCKLDEESGRVRDFERKLRSNETANVEG